MKHKVKKWKLKKILILLLTGFLIFNFAGCTKKTQDTAVQKTVTGIQHSEPQRQPEIQDSSTDTAAPKAEPESLALSLPEKETAEKVIESNPVNPDTVTEEQDPIIPPVSIETDKPVPVEIEPEAESPAQIEQTEPVPDKKEAEIQITEELPKLSVSNIAEEAVEPPLPAPPPPDLQSAEAVNRPELIPTEEPAVDKAVILGKTADISITTPATPFYYRSELNITGSLSGIPSGAELNWNIPETELAGELERTGQDSFKAVIDLTNIEGTQVCRVAAYIDDKILAEDLLVLVDDNRGPYIEFLTPDQTEFSRDVIISGRIKDSAESSSFNEVKTFKMTCLNTSEIFTIDFTDEGFFNFPLNRLSGNFSLSPSVLLQFTAEDFNNNISSDYLTLYTSKNSILFDITSPGNGTTFTDSISVSGKTEKVQKISWNIVGTGLSGTADVVSGLYSFDVRTSGLGDTALIKLSAESGTEISERFLKIYNSLSGPLINIQQPVQGGFYKSGIHVKGILSAPQNSISGIESVKALNWNIPGNTGMTGSVFFDENGGFEFEIPIRKYNGLLPLEIFGEDFNGNTGRKIFILSDGNIPPDINISSPSDNTKFGAAINIAGTVKDPYIGTSLEGIQFLNYELTSIENYSEQAITGTLQINDNGTFAGYIPAYSLNGKYQLKLDTESMNGNSTSKIINIERGDTGIGGLSLKYSGNRITASWDSINEATSYTFYLSDDRSDPDNPGSVKLTSSDAQIVLSGIQPGLLYRAKVTADTPYGNLKSDIAEILPIEANTIKLNASGEFRQISLSWNSIPGSDSFDVYRSESTDGDYVLISQVINDLKYTDRNVNFGIEYFYRISPSGYPEPGSKSSSATILKAPEERVKSLDTLTSFKPNSISISGNYAYVAAGDSGLRIVDISDVSNMSVTGSLELKSAENLIVSGDYVYVACRENGIAVVNILDPVSPFLAGTKLTGNALDLAVDRNTLYVADGDSGLKIMDVSDARFPDRIASLSDSGSYALYMSGNQLFSADTNALNVFDRSDSRNLQNIKTYPIGGIRDLEIIDTRLYTVSSDEGFIITDITDITNPFRLSSFKLNSPLAVSVKDNFAYIADGNSGLKIINVSNPVKPVIFDSYTSEPAVDLKPAGDNLVVAGSNGLTAIQTYLKGVSFSTGKDSFPGKVSSIHLSRTNALVSAKDGGLYLLDISSPSVQEHQSIKIADYGGPAVILDNSIYFSSGIEELAVLKTDGSNLSLNNTINTMPLSVSPTSPILKLSASQNTAIASCGTAGVYFFTGEELIGHISTTDARDCTVIRKTPQTTTAYIADRRDGLLVYDVTDFENIGLYTAKELNSPKFVSISGNTLYTGDKSGIHIFDIEIEQKPEEVGFIKTNYAEDIFVSNETLYIAEGYKGLSVYDTSNPATPVILSVCDTVYAADIEVYGDFALIADITGINYVKIFIPSWMQKKSR